MSLMCIKKELAGETSVAVAAGVSDKWQVTGDTQHVGHDTWHMTHEMGHVYT